MGSASPTSHLRVRLLGAFSVHLQGNVVLSLKGPRLESLFANLVIHPGVPRQRRHLAAALWPETTDEQSQTNLRTLLHRLRTAFPEADRFLRSDGGYLLWNADPDCWVDVVQFEADASAARALPAIEQAIRLYGGDLLPGCEDPWVEGERERLRRTHLGLLDRAAALHEASGHFRQALAWTQVATRAEPFNEKHQRRLIRLHALSGDRAAGIRAYEAFESLVRTELGTEPDPQTREACMRLRTYFQAENRSGGSVDAGSMSQLIGRVAAWASLRTAWKQVQAGGVRVAVLEGEAGIGKTRLAEEFATWTERQGISTARGRAYRMSGGLVFIPIVPWLRRGLDQPGVPALQEIWLAEVARVLPDVLHGHSSPGGGEEGFDFGRKERFFEALARAVLRAPQPLVLVLDDLQWCDPDLLAWLRFLVGFDDTARLLLLLTWRSDELGAAAPSTAFVRELEREALLTRVELQPLDAEQSAALAAAAAAPGSDPPAPSTYAVARGNPLFIIEMVRAGQGGQPEGGQGPPAGTTMPPAVPPTIRGVIQERLERLTPDQREVVDAAAAVGRDFDLQLLATVSGASADRTARALDELCARRVFAEEPGERYDFHHELVREVAYGDIGTLRRRKLHRAVAEALASASDPPDRLSEIAAHYDQAGMAGPAMSYHLSAARRMFQIGATAASIAQLERACALAELAGGEAELAMEIHEQLGDVLHVAARYADARCHFEMVLSAVDHPLPRARLRRKIARTHTGERDFQQAAECLEQAGDLLRAASDRGPDWSREWVQVSLDRMGMLYWTTNWNRIEQLRLETASELDRHGTPAQRRQFRFSLIGMLLRRDRLVVCDEIVALARENLDSAVEEGSATAVAVTRFHLAYVLLWGPEPALAEDQLVEALALAERTADRTLACRCLTYFSVLYRKLQLPQRTREYAMLAHAAATELGIREYTGVSFANRAWLSWKQERFGEALGHGRAAVAEWSDRPRGAVAFAAQWLGLWPLLASRLATGGEAGKLPDALQFARGLLACDQARLPDEITSCLTRAMTAANTGGEGDAERHLLRATELARQHRYL